VTVPNTGATDATSVTVFDALTTGLSIVGTPVVTGNTGTVSGTITVAPGLNIGTVAAGGTATITFNVLVNAVPTPNPFTNSVEIDSAETAPVTVPGGTIDVIEPSAPDFGNTTKVVNNVSPQVGDTITYTVTVPNVGETDATSVTVFDALTVGLNLVGTPIVTGNIGSISGSITVAPGLNIGTVAAGGTATVIFDVLISEIPVPNPYTNIVQIDSAETTPITKPGGPINVGIPGTGGANLGNTSKFVNNGTPSVGDVVNYTIEIPNDGEEPAINVTVFDALTTGLSLVGSPSVTGTVGAVSGNLTVAPGINIGTILAGATATLNFSVKVDSIPVPNPYNNKANVSYTDSTGNNTFVTEGGQLNVGGVGGANLGGTIKDASDTTPQIGDAVTYKIEIPNAGPVPANNVTLYDALPTELVLVGSPTVTGASGPITGVINIMPGLNIGTIAAGATAIVEFVVSVEAIPNPNPFENKVRITFEDVKGNHNLNVTGGTLTVTPSEGANLNGATKDTNKGEALVGDIISYTVNIPNTGSKDALNVTVLDELPIGLAISGIPVVTGNIGTVSGNIAIAPGLSIGTVIAGTTAVVTFDIIINQIPDPSNFENKAIIKYTDEDGKPGVTVTPGVTTEITGGTGGANLGNTSKFVNNGVPSVGDIVNYTIEIPNDGEEAATNVRILDTLTPGLSLVGIPVVTGTIGTQSGDLTVAPGLNIGTILVGSIATVKFNVRVDSIPTPNPYNNKANISYTDSDGTSTFVTEGGQLNVGGAGGANLGETIKDASDTSPQVGDAVTYTIEIPNKGPVPANNVTLYDALPTELILVGAPIVTGASGLGSGILNEMPGLNIGTIAAGATAKVVFVVSVEAIPNPNPFENKVRITFDDIKGNHNLNVTGGTLTVTASEGANLTGAIKDANKGTAAVGEIISYTLNIPNTGVKDALNVTVLDELPVGLVISGTPVVTGNIGSISGNITVAPGLNIGTVIAGATAIVSFDIKVNEIPDPADFENKAIIKYTDEDGKPGTTVTPGITTEITGGPDFGGDNFKKSANKVYADIDEIVTYKFEIKNDSTVVANNVIVKDELSASLEFIQGSIKVNGASVAGNIETGVNIGSIAGGQSIIVTFNVKALQTGIIVNKGDISYSFSGGTGSEESTENILQINSGKLGPNDVEKESNRDFTVVGDIVTYTVSINNSGNVAITDVVVKDPLSSALKFVPGSIKVNGNPVVGNIVSGIIIASVEPGALASVTFEAEVLVEGIITNTVNVDYSYKVDPNGPDIDKNTNATSDPIESINPEDGLIIEKTSSQEGVIVGDIITYTIKATNTNLIPINNVVIVDDLAPGLEYKGNLTINGIASSQSIFQGVNVGTLNPNESIEVSFDAKIVSRPANGEIFNTVDVEFEYTLGDKTFTGNVDGNGKEITVFDADIKTSKKANVSFVKVGETFEYTITMINEGNIDAENAFIKDDLPMEFEVLEIKVDGVIVPGNIETGLNLGGIAIGETKVIVILVKVNGLVENFINVAEAIIEFKPDPNGPESELEIDIVETDQEGNEGGIQVINPRLTMVKRTKQLAAVVGEIVDYEVLITNDGNVDIFDAKVSDLLDENLEFVIGSVRVNGKSKADENINAGVTIPKIKIGESVKLEFKAKVLGKEEDIISNQALASYNFFIDGEKQFGDDLSNVNELSVSFVNLDINKYSNVDFAVLNDVIEYTIVIENNGEVDAQNIVIKDKLPKYVVLIPGTFKVDGVIVNSVNLEKGVVIGDIEVNETVTIIYKVKVVGTACNAKLVNAASAKFMYELDGVVTGEIEVTGPDSENSIDMGISTFKQLSVEEELQIPIAKPDVEALNEMTGTIDIMGCHLIETGAFTSQEGQRLTGFKLVITGALNLVVKYTALDTEQSVHSAHYKLPFSTFVVMPDGYSVGSKLDVEGIVEDIYYKQHDLRCFFTNTTLLINVKILDC
jgi:uncharacterized repeat protein (TIGR01451 family)